MNIELNRFRIHQIADLQPTLRDNFVATLLVPEFLKQSLDEHLETQKISLSILLRNLVYRYRKPIMANNLPVNHHYRRSYQPSGLSLQKRSLRPEPEVWELFSIMADFLGLSRCHLFATLLWIEISRSREEGVPTTRLEHYDIHYPHYIEIRKRLYPGKKPKIRREIISEPEPPERTPHWLFPYPQNIQWIGYVIQLRAEKGTN